LEIEGGVVRVIQMGIRTTLARTRDDEEIIVPNAVLVQSVVKNFTLRDSLYRVRVSVGVTYDSDMRLVLDTLRRIADEVEWKSAQKPPRVLMTEFGNSSVNFDVSVWVDDPWEAPSARSELHQTIWWALKEVGVVIAFPQLDVHLDEPVSRSLELLAPRCAPSPYRMTRARIVPCCAWSAQARGSSAFPTMAPMARYRSRALIATPGWLDATRRSPVAIGPPSRQTSISLWPLMMA
jgi:hypothetical protein